jgi:hypothetical protein
MRHAHLQQSLSVSGSVTLCNFFKRTCKLLGPSRLSGQPDPPSPQTRVAESEMLHLLRLPLRIDWDFENHKVRDLATKKAR